MNTREAFIIYISYLIILFIGIKVVFFFKKPTPKNLVYEVTYLTVDSTWYTTPGQENSMQTECKYYARLNNGKVIRTSNKPFEIGDTAQVVTVNEK
jgi:hypothetical protein